MPEPDRPRKMQDTYKYSFYLAGVWTSLVLASLFWSLHRVHEGHMENARIEARTLYDMTLAYRSWDMSHGNVYVPITDKISPQPFRTAGRHDLTGKGKKAALVNPAWMTLEVFDALRSQSSLPVINHITSLRYLNPLNKPDAWEEKGLRDFERGSSEVSAMQFIEGRPYMRLMKPFTTQESCLKCHGSQGYKPGDIRGGMSIAIPLNLHFQAEAKEKKAVAATHAVFWIIGMGGVILFNRNVRSTQARIAEREEKYRLLFEKNPHPMWVYDLETFAFLTVNNSAIDHYGYSRDEFLSMTIKDIRPGEDVPALVENVSRVTDRVDHAGIWRHRKKDGSVIFVEITSHVLDFAGRRAELVLAHDVSDRKRLEDELRHSQKLEAVGLLAGGVAHDFNNILTAIIGYSSLMKLKLQEKDPLTHNVDEVIASAERGALLTQSLLAFSRKQIMKPQLLDLNRIIEQAARLLVRLIGEDIKLEIIPGRGKITVIADSGQMEQVLMNLATNARDSMPEGGYLTLETGRIVLDQRFIAAHNYGKPGEYAVITISDTGIGMDKKTAIRIFEPFFTTKELGRGTGLGLSIVYGIVKQHNGFINVYTEPGQGTTFKIYLPFAIKSGEQAGKVGSPAALKSGTETILVAEDDMHVRALVRSVLEEFGYRVIEAADGEDALSKVRHYREEIQLLLLDVIMPKKNGKEVYEEARRLIPGIRALFSSGYTADIVHKKGILDEGLNFISKPVSPSELVRKVREVLDKQG